GCATHFPSEGRTKLFDQGKYPLTTSTAYSSLGMSKGDNDMPYRRVKQHIPKELRYSVRDFNNEFPDDSSCLAYIAEQRYPNGVALCAACKTHRKHHRVGNRTAYACDHCGHHMYPLKGTIFEKSSTSLRLWFYAAYLMGSTRCGI